VQQKRGNKTVPEDACENWNPRHKKIATHETDIGDLCDKCFNLYVADEMIDKDGRMIQNNGGSR